MAIELTRKRVGLSLVDLFTGERAVVTAALAALLMTGLSAGMGVYYFVGTAFIGGILLWEHSIVRPGDLSRLNMAFFTLNGYVSMAFLAATLADIFLITR